jgi:DNA-binding IclR family transcriptional regulator
MPITMGWVLRQDNDPDGARASFEAALRISRRSGYLFDLAYASLGLACVAADLGDPRRAGDDLGMVTVSIPWAERLAGRGGTLAVPAEDLGCTWSRWRCGRPALGVAAAAGRRAAVHVT